MVVSLPEIKLSLFLGTDQMGLPSIARGPPLQQHPSHTSMKIDARVTLYIESVRFISKWVGHFVY